MTPPLTITDTSGLAPLHPVLPHAVLYTKPVCPNCDVLKRQLRTRKIAPIAIDITQTPDALHALNVELGLSGTPIVLVHNVFERPVFFWGKGAVPVDQGKILAQSMRERLAHLVAAGDIDAQTSDAYLADMVEQARLHNEKTPALDIAEYLTIAQATIPVSEHEQRRVRLAPGNELTSTAADAPAILMTR